MPLQLYLHPLASFCHKVLIALYEQCIEFEPKVVDFGDPEASASFMRMWPLGKIPVLRDEERQQTIPETSIIIEYLDLHYANTHKMIPSDRDLALQARLWDRFFDNYVQVPMQKIVADKLRAEHERDPKGVADARAALQQAYAMIDRQVADKEWAIGSMFSLADCAATPALFYAHTLVPFDAAQSRLASYFERLLARPSVRRTLAEAQPYFQFYPFREQIPARFFEF